MADVDATIADADPTLVAARPAVAEVTEAGVNRGRPGAGPACGP